MRKPRCSEDKPAYIHAGRLMEWRNTIERHIDRQTDKETDRQRQRDIWMERKTQTDRQTEKK